MSSGIVVGYDGSEYAKAAVRMALDLARAFGGEKVIVAFGYELSPVGGELHDYHLALKDMAKQRLAEATSLASQDGADVEGVVVERDPAHGLVELADQRDARLIVVGTRGESAILGALLGSTPHKLLQVSDRPVVVVPSTHD
jgi:nucleotide-binding universal stress UspA family protein